MCHNKYVNSWISILCCCLIFNDCGNAKTNQINSAKLTYNLKKSSELLEYMSKISQRILMVSDDPSLSIIFHIKDNNEKVVTIAKNGAITISRKALEALRDESQLAAIIGYGIIQSKTNCHGKEAAKYDQQNIINLSKAGYNPIAIMELQEMVIKNNKKKHWLANIFLQPMTNSRIETNKKLIRNLPNGSLRTEQSYQKTLGLLD